MLGVTFFGLLLTPVFYVVIRWFIERKQSKLEHQHDKQPVAQASHIMLMLVLAPGLLGLVSGCKASGAELQRTYCASPHRVCQSGSTRHVDG